LFHISHWEAWSFVLGFAKPTKAPWRLDWLPSDVYFENCITKPCQVKHRRFGCSVAITTSYARL